MDLATLRMFKTVAEEGGITAAARKLNRVQSNVSTRIRQLEAALGVELFVRRSRKLFLSPAGARFLEHAAAMLEAWERARAALHDSVPRGVLRIGTLESTAASRLPAVLAGYHRKFGEVRIELVTGTTDALIEALLRREIDAAFVADRPRDPRLEATAAFRERLVAIAPRTHPPIRRASDIQTRTVVAFPAGCAYRRRLQRWLGGDGVVPERVLELGSYHAIVACVASGAGVAVVPRSVLDTIRDRAGVADYPLPARIAATTTSLVWRRAERSLALDALARAARERRGPAAISRRSRSRREAPA